MLLSTELSRLHLDIALMCISYFIVFANYTLFAWFLFLTFITVVCVSVGAHMPQYMREDRGQLSGVTSLLQQWVIKLWALCPYLLSHLTGFIYFMTFFLDCGNDVI